MHIQLPDREKEHAAEMQRITDETAREISEIFQRFASRQVPPDSELMRVWDEADQCEAPTK